MSTFPALPSYATFKNPEDFDPERLRNGSYQDEALAFFAKVVKEFGPYDLNEIYCNLYESMIGDGSVSDSDRTYSPFLYNTVALAVCKDIRPFSTYLFDEKHYLFNETLSIKEVEKTITNNFKDLQVDHVRQFVESETPLLLRFSTLYGIYPTQLAEKIVLEDNGQAFLRFYSVHSSRALAALARIPFDPASEIRQALLEKRGYLICQDEMIKRYDNQLTALYSLTDGNLLNPKGTHNLHQGTFEFQTLPQIDHGLRNIPGYMEFLKDRPTAYLGQFHRCGHNMGALDTEQAMLLANLMDDFENAGLKSLDILVKGILGHAHMAENDFLSCFCDNDQSTKIWGVESHRKYTPQEKHELYLKFLMKKSAQLSDNSQSPYDETQLRQINHLIRKEPIGLMEGVCTEEAHWNALYRATSDKQYLKRMQGRLDRALEADLGL